jgi:segregation and condensation protein A
VNDLAETLPEPHAPAVDLGVFAGPLDLLLHLIKQEQVSIYDIPIARICDQYHEHLGAMRELDLQLAGEFLWMASWLLQLKSRMLLPSAADGGEDPRAELVDRLVEYRRVKELAAMLYELHTIRSHQWGSSVSFADSGEGPELDWEDVDLDLLARAYHMAMERFDQANPPPLAVIPLRFTVEEKMREIFATVRTEGAMPLLRHLLRSPSSDEVIALIVAALELVRLGGVIADQVRPFAEIYLRATGRDLDPDNFFAVEGDHGA